MEITESFVYCILMLDNVKSTLFGLQLLGWIVVIVVGVIWFVEYCRSADGNRVFISVYKRAIISLIVMSAISAFIPDTRQAATIVILPKIASIDLNVLDKIPPKVWKLLDAVLPVHADTKEAK